MLIEIPYIGRSSALLVSLIQVLAADPIVFTPS